MKNKILGLHHITAITGHAQRNYDFYAKGLGQRLVKRTVNFDDPHTYHFYFGNQSGEPGTILTFFPWEDAVRGSTGNGMATEIGYSVPENSLDWWSVRLRELGATVEPIQERFGEKVLAFSDPDGLNIVLIVPNKPDSRIPWNTPAVPKESATRGFHSVTVTVRKLDPTAMVLTDIFGYTLERQDGNRYRFTTDAVPNASIVDVLEGPAGSRGLPGAGTNHHVAFRVLDEASQMEFREKVAIKGLQVTPKIDRDYFYSIYFREPGGVLFEIATDNPGFTVDEPLAILGTQLKLPSQFEPLRTEIEEELPPLTI